MNNFLCWLTIYWFLSLWFSLFCSIVLLALLFAIGIKRVVTYDLINRFVGVCCQEKPGVAAPSLSDKALDSLINLRTKQPTSSVVTAQKPAASAVQRPTIVSTKAPIIPIKATATTISPIRLPTTNRTANKVVPVAVGSRPISSTNQGAVVSVTRRPTLVISTTSRSPLVGKVTNTKETVKSEGRT